MVILNGVLLGRMAPHRVHLGGMAIRRGVKLSRMDVPGMYYRYYPVPGPTCAKWPPFGALRPVACTSARRHMNSSVPALLPALRPGFVAAAYASSVKMEAWPSMEPIGLVFTVVHRNTSPALTPRNVAAQLKLKETFESVASYYSFKRFAAAASNVDCIGSTCTALFPSAFNVGFIGSTCTALPRRSGQQLPPRHRGYHRRNVIGTLQPDAVHPLPIVVLENGIDLRQVHFLPDVPGQAVDVVAAFVRHVSHGVEAQVEIESKV